MRIKLDQSYFDIAKQRIEQAKGDSTNEALSSQCDIDCMERIRVEH